MERPIQTLVAFDFSPSSACALERAVDVAARAPQHVLHIVAAIDPHDRLSVLTAGEVPTYETAERVHQLIVRHVTAAFAGRPTAADVKFFVHARIGKPVKEILDVAEEIGADLIFIGNHGNTGVERFLLGSISERVVREARCPVMVARAKTYKDVELAPVVFYDHERAPHRAPHCYSYSNRQVISQPPPEWTAG